MIVRNKTIKRFGEEVTVELLTVDGRVLAITRATLQPITIIKFFDLPESSVDKIRIVEFEAVQTLHPDGSPILLHTSQNDIEIHLPLEIEDIRPNSEVRDATP